MYYHLLEPDNTEDFGSVSLETIVSSIGTLLMIALIFSMVSNVIKYTYGGLKSVGKAIWDQFTV